MNYWLRLYRVCWYLPLLFPISFWGLYAYHDYGKSYTMGNGIDASPMMFFAVGFFAACACMLLALAKLIWKKIPLYKTDVIFLLAGVLLSLLTLNSHAMNWYLD